MTKIQKIYYIGICPTDAVLNLDIFFDSSKGVETIEKWTFYKFGFWHETCVVYSLLMIFFKSVELPTLNRIAGIPGKRFQTMAPTIKEALYSELKDIRRFK